MQLKKRVSWWGDLEAGPWALVAGLKKPTMGSSERRVDKQAERGTWGLTSLEGDLFKGGLKVGDQNKLTLFKQVV